MRKWPGKQGGEKQGLENGVKISLGGEKKQSTHPPQPKVEVDPELARQQAAEMASYLERYDVHGLVQSLVADLVSCALHRSSGCPSASSGCATEWPVALGRAYGRLLEMRLDRGQAISDALADAFNFFAPERMGGPLGVGLVMLLRAVAVDVAQRPPAPPSARRPAAHAQQPPRRAAGE